MSSGPAFKCDVCGKMEGASTIQYETELDFMRPPGVTAPLAGAREPIGWFTIVYQSSLALQPARNACGEDCAQMLIINCVLEAKT